MKKLLLLIIISTLGLGLKAQCPLATAVDFTATDCHGNEVHLFDILDSGQYVFIDFFYTTCGTCLDWVPSVVESYNAFGCNQHDVFYLEISDRDDDDACQDWATSHGVEYPTISGTAEGNSITNQYGINSWPTLILIAPDRSILIHDLYPVSNAQSIISALEAQGVTQHSCNPEDVMPDFTSNDIDGNEIRLYDILDGGQAVLINFFLYGDPFSEDIMKDMVEAYHLYGCNEHDVFFMEISPNGNDSQCHTWVESFDVEYPTISRNGGGNTIAQSIPVGFYPTIMLIRPDHTIAVRDIYPPTLEQITHALEGEGYEQYECDVNAVETHRLSFRLFPNPTNDFVTLSGEGLGTVSVYNALGQKIDDFNANGAELRIKTTSYENGVYFIKTDNGTIRFIVKH